jgi:hypothetical protein
MLLSTGRTVEGGSTSTSRAGATVSATMPALEMFHVEMDGEIIIIGHHIVELRETNQE